MTYLNVGAINKNDVATLKRFATYFGRRPNLSMLYFNQETPTSFLESIEYIDNMAKAYLAAGAANIVWSVPVPAYGQLEAIIYGTYDAAYTEIANRIKATSAAASRNYVRLPWEGNLDGGPTWGQSNVAKDAAGNWNTLLHAAAQTHVAQIIRPILGSKAFIIACPNICANDHVDPRALIPDPSLIDCIDLDFYMQKKYNKPGDFNWFRTHPRGLDFWVNTAKALGLKIGFGELGFDDNGFVNDLVATINYAKVNAFDHLLYWDRDEVIDCTISDGSHAALAAAFKAGLA